MQHMKGKNEIAPYVEPLERKVKMVSEIQTLIHQYRVDT
jgi:hypothetical protein